MLRLEQSNQAEAHAVQVYVRRHEDKRDRAHYYQVNYSIGRIEQRISAHVTEVTILADEHEH